MTSATIVWLRNDLRVSDHPALHAAALGFIHPTRNQSLRFEVPLPADLARLLAVLEARE